MLMDIEGFIEDFDNESPMKIPLKCIVDEMNAWVSSMKKSMNP